MDNKKSRVDRLKGVSVSIHDSEENYVRDVYIQMIIDEALLFYKKDLLEKQINHALDKKNKERFFTLTEQYNQLMKGC